jgi:hypothetical protein
MSCSPFDLKDYFLKELTVPQAAQVEDHIHTCSGCREEFDRLRLTEAALFSLRDEEIPQRIGFVSDKIFEPSPVRRWTYEFWEGDLISAEQIKLVMGELEEEFVRMYDGGVYVWPLLPVHDQLISEADEAIAPLIGEIKSYVFSNVMRDYWRVPIKADPEIMNKWVKS